MRIGQHAPSISVETDGEFFCLKNHLGKNVALFFFPKADTSGCTKEAVAFSALLAEFEAANAIVIRISRDTPEIQAQFRAKHKLTCMLGCDVDGQVCENYEVWVEKSMYGRKYMGIERASFLINPDGTIGHIWRNVKVPGHAEQVLEKIQAGG